MTIIIITVNVIIKTLFFYMPGWIWSQVEGNRVADVVGAKVTTICHNFISVTQFHISRNVSSVFRAYVHWEI